MSKRYVIQVLDAVTDENAKNVYDVETAEQDEPMTAWFNVQHPSGNGDWMTRSRTTALNDAVTLVFKGETRALRIAVSQPVYSLTPVPELDVAAAVAIAKQIGQDMAAEAEANGVSLDDVLAHAIDDADDDDDDDDDDESEDTIDTGDSPPYYLK